MLTKNPRSFQTECVIEIGISYFYISVLKMLFQKLPPEVINFRDFKKFDSERFTTSLLYTLNEERTDYSKKP